MTDDASNCGTIDRRLANARKRAANARLIAAAPDLLAALEAVSQDLRECIESMPLGDMQRAIMQTGIALRLADAAIAKARDPEDA